MAVKFSYSDKVEIVLADMIEYSIDAEEGAWLYLGIEDEENNVEVKLDPFQARCLAHALLDWGDR